MCNLSNTESRKVLFLDPYSVLLTPVTFHYLSKFLVVFLLMTQQSTVLTLTWETHTIRVTTGVCQQSFRMRRIQAFNFSMATYLKPKCCCSLRIKTSHTVLVVTIGRGLSWSSNVTTLCKSTSKKIYTTLFEPSGQKMIPSCPYSIHCWLWINTVALGKYKYPQTIG